MTIPRPPYLGGLNELDWDAEAEELFYLLAGELSAAAQTGSAALLLELAQRGVPLAAVDWSQVNTAAADWAARYTYDLVRQLTETTREQLQKAVAAWNATPGMTRGDLERLILEGPAGITDLTTARGIIPAARRAEMIAVTETTRAYSAGEVEAMQATGLPQVRPTQQPPAHVGCRCNVSPLVRADGVMSWEWQTLNDDLVCPICRPLHGQDVGVASSTSQPEQYTLSDKVQFRDVGDALLERFGTRAATEAERSAFLAEIDKLPDEIKRMWTGKDVILAISPNSQAAYHQGKWIVLGEDAMEAAQHEFIHHIIGQGPLSTKIGAYKPSILFEHASLSTGVKLEEDLAMMLTYYRRNVERWKAAMLDPRLAEYLATGERITEAIAAQKIKEVQDFLVWMGYEL